MQYMEAFHKPPLVSKEGILDQVEKQISHALEKKPEGVTGFFINGTQEDVEAKQVLYTGVIVLTGEDKTELKFIGNYLEELFNQAMVDVDFDAIKDGKPVAKYVGEEDG